VQASGDLQLRLYVTGMHLAPQFGRTVEMIERDGFQIAERIEMLLASDTAEGIAKSMGLGMLGFAQAFARQRPDWLLLLGDRFEMLAAASAALPFNIPIAHVHGGELTEGLIDEAIRHSLTKMSHLHFVSTEAYARRVIQMGEAPERVTVSGAPSLDNLKSVRLLSLGELRAQRGLRLEPGFLLVTYHPVTLEGAQTAEHLDEFLGALEQSGRDILFTYPNADTNSRQIIEKIEAFVAKHSRAQLAVNLGTQGYFSVMRHAAAMVGNSSSGIIEAASFQLPVVNVGNRQRGRVTGANVVHTGTRREEVLAGIERALALKLNGMENPYGDGNAAGRIIERLRTAGPDLLIKRFHNLA
jgi:UDP-hydrolysing UDP-N-acetyl-D-glucosamine 2-epimerase